MARKATRSRPTVEKHLERSDSIYALAVTTVVKKSWGGETLRLIVALCLTVSLQLALVGLLWQVASTGNLNSKRGEADNIWVELGRTRRHLVALQDQVMHPQPDKVLPAPCLESLCKYWPHFPGAGLLSKSKNDTELLKECLDYFCCFALHPECLLRSNQSEVLIWEQHHADVSQIVNVTCYANFSAGLSNMTREQYEESLTACSPSVCTLYAAAHELPELEYGWGLFHISDSMPSQRDGCVERHSGLEERNFAGHVNDWFHRTSYEHEPTVFVMVSYLVMLVVSFNEVRQALHLLVYSAAKAGALPNFYNPKPGQAPEAQDLSGWSTAFILAAPVLQALVAFVLMACGGGLVLLTDLQSTAGTRASIIFNAVALAFVVELDDRIGLIMKMQEPWLPESASRQDATDRSGQQPGKHLGGRATIGGASASSGSCRNGIGSSDTKSQRDQADKDNKSGGEISMEWSDNASRSSSTTGTNTTGAVSNTQSLSRRPLAGYVLFGVVGWLLLSHVLLVAPQTPAQVLVFFTTVSAYHAQRQALKVLETWTSDPDYRDGMTFNFFMDPLVRAIDYVDHNASIWNKFAFLGFAGLASLEDEEGKIMGRSSAIWLCSMYLVAAVLLVLVLCHSLLPCESPCWPWGLTIVQIVLVIVAQLQHLTGNKWKRLTFDEQLQYAAEHRGQPFKLYVEEARNSSNLAVLNSEPMAVQRYGFVAVLATLFVLWLVMFVMWPFIYWGQQTKWKSIKTILHDCWSLLLSSVKRAAKTVDDFMHWLWQDTTAVTQPEGPRDAV